MKNLKIESTECTFGIDFNAEKNILKFSGESRPENCPEFFSPILNWMEDYNKFLYYKIGVSVVKELTITVDFKLDYFNSTSAKYILDILLFLNKLQRENPTVLLAVNWFYKSIDEDMLDCGEEFKKMSGLTINLVSFD
ncbi:MAG: DUF1987 domain-containing protein [Bacteroidetes bacterium]|nr:DUF1987 domain-containing protein [Bacteroidota bacterium]